MEWKSKSLELRQCHFYSSHMILQLHPYLFHLVIREGRSVPLNLICPPAAMPASLNSISPPAAMSAPLNLISPPAMRCLCTRKNHNFHNTSQLAALLSARCSPLRSQPTVAQIPSFMWRTSSMPWSPRQPAGVP